MWLKTERREDELRPRRAPVWLFLIAIFLMSLIIRSYFGHETATKYGAPYLYSGGSDSYYHARAIEYFQTHKQHLTWDFMLCYPFGTMNPRPPLYDDGIALLGIFGSALFGTELVSTTSYIFIWSTAIFSAFAIFPVYLIGKEVFGRRAGLLAALLLAVMAGNVERSVLTNTDYDSIVLFFVVSGFYFFIRALRTLHEKKWVRDWGEAQSVIFGLRDFFVAHRVSLLYAAMAGMCTATVALTWQGFSYMVVIIVLYFAIQILIYRLRMRDLTGLFFVFVVTVGVGLFVSYPYYVSVSQIPAWWDAPFYMYLACIVLATVLMVTRDYPWALVLPAVIGSFIVALAILSVVSPATVNTFLSGQGFFIKSKLYTTIAEAQAPGFSHVALSFGAATFIIALFGIGYALYTLRKRWVPVYLFIVVWGTAAVGMTLSQARFIYNSSPIFALIAGWMLALLWDKVNFQEIARTYETYRGQKLRALRKCIKLKHIAAVLFFSVIVLLPNLWYAVDAGIPFQIKRKCDKQVYEVMPDFLRPPGYDAKNGSHWYFGAYGYDLPTPSHYWTHAYKWLSQQDSDVLPYERRPGFLSWWDYGFEAIQQGKHPSVADNFQTQYQFAGSFIMAQSEWEGIALLVALLVNGDAYNNLFQHKKLRLSENVVAVLEKYGFTREQVEDVIVNARKYVSVVKSQPEKYGYYNPDLYPENAKYAYLRVLFLSLGHEQVVNLYHELYRTTGKIVRYFAIDSRLYPFSGMNTGIFYAPAKLADKRMTGRDNTIPIDYYIIKAKDTLGNKYELDKIPLDVRLDPSEPYVIEYQPAFYNTLLYRCYIGYSGQEVGLGEGVPGLSGSVANQQPMPGWNMSHFRQVYRTAYWNPHTDAQNYPEDWVALNYDEAFELQKQQKGVSDLSARSSLYQGVTFLKYYSGAFVNGTVSIRESGIGVPNVWVTVADEYGIPHHYVRTDRRGRYTLIAPFGNLTLTVSSGELNKFTMLGSTTLNETKLTVTDAQAMREEIDRDGDGTWDYNIRCDIFVGGGSIEGTVYWDTNADGNYTSGEPTIGDVELELRSSALDYSTNLTVARDGKYKVLNLVPSTYELRARLYDHLIGPIGATVGAGATITTNIGLKPARINGTVMARDGSVSGDTKVELYDATNKTTLFTYTSATGRFEFDNLLPGNFTLRASKAGQITLEHSFKLVQNSKLSFNLTLYPSARVSGNVKHTSTKNVVLYFISAKNSSLVKSVTADTSGHYSVELPKGEYYVETLYYFSGIPYGYIAKLAVAEPMQFDIALAELVSLNGTAYYQNRTNYKSKLTLLFEHQATGGLMRSVTNTRGEYKVLLPRGEYVVKVSEEQYGFGYTLLTSLKLTSAMCWDASLKKGRKITGKVYYDINRNRTLDVNESVPDAELSFEDQQGRRLSTWTDTEGNYSIWLPEKEPFSLKVRAENFQPRILRLEELEKLNNTVALEPLPVHVHGKVVVSNLLSASPVRCRIQFEAVKDGAESNSTETLDGHYELYLLPGHYNITVHQNLTPDGTSVLLHHSTLYVGLGETSIERDLSLSYELKVRGRVVKRDDGNPEFNASISFMAVDTVRNTATNKTGWYELYVPADQNYTIKATKRNETTLRDYIALVQRPVSKTLYINLTLEHSFQLGGTVYCKDKNDKKGGVSLRINAKSTNAWLSVRTDDNGYYKVDLPPDTYNVSIDYSVLEHQYVRYFGSILVNLTSSLLSEDIRLKRVFDNTTFFGTLRDEYGNGFQVVLELQPASPSAVATRLKVSAEGTYSASVAPGNYTAYVSVSAYTLLVYFGKLSIPHQPQFGMNLTLVPGRWLTGFVRKNGGNLPYAVVTVARSDAEKLILADENGHYKVALPPGSYTLNASAQVREYGQNVTYTGSCTAMISYDDVVTELRLMKSKRYGVTLNWPKTQKQTIHGGEHVTYTLTIKNTGNEPDHYKLNAEPGNWRFQFSPSELTLNPDEEKVVTVVITAPADARVAHETLKISVSSPNANNNVLVEVGIYPVYGVRLSESKGRTLSYLTALTYTLSLQNTGNIEDTFWVRILNFEDLDAKGWTVGLKYGNQQGLKLYNISIAAGSSVSIELIVNATKPYSPVMMPIMLEGLTNKTSKTSILTLTPARPMLNLPPARIRGEALGMPSTNYLPYVMLAMVAAVGMMFLYWFSLRRRIPK